MEEVCLLKEINNFEFDSINTSDSEIIKNGFRL